MEGEHFAKQKRIDQALKWCYILATFTCEYITVTQPWHLLPASGPNVMIRPEILAQNPIDEDYSAEGIEAQPRRILIAEDNEVIRELAREILEFLGFEVYVAENGKLALQLALQETFDLILMDCQMPVLDGYEATRRFRLLESEICRGTTPIVALSGNPIAEGREHCLAAGMDDYLQKPFTINELRKIINYWTPVPRS